ncbi:hypothetical protein BSZ35_19155 [Salinibacter sp. 10B]|uniref:hypothetical protein n=1 Tax=Salinibacter sp. 10B TaxID=1923971 RepID=UPI000CF49D6E|nr:hypothetical protein [Salinibacter sp. 10B]PQJ26768.1 hypothetical protein BSZ35_19155 [Salinibacter sp. 10B]
MDTSTFQFWGTIAALVLGLISALPQLASFTSWVGAKVGGTVGRWLTRRLLFIEEAKKDETFAAVYAARQLGTAIFALTIMITFEFTGLENQGPPAVNSEGVFSGLIERISYLIELGCILVIGSAVGTVTGISRRMLLSRIETEPESMD